VRLTNRFNADEAIVAAVANDSYDAEGSDISITGLCQPPQIRQLVKRHGANLTEDVSDRLASLRGQCAHAIMERSGKKGPWTEKRIFADVLGWKISGKPDQFEAMTLEGGVLTDFKFPSLSSFKFSFQRDKGLKPEYIAQGNGYRWLLAQHGVTVNRIVFKPTLLEWSPRHARTKAKEGYPDRPFYNFEIPLWTLGEAQDWIYKRVRLHQAAEKMPDHLLPECDNDERWGQPARFAIKKQGQKNAIRHGVKETRAEAEAMLKTLDDKHYIEDRPGEKVRCVDYCTAGRGGVCQQLRREMPEGVDMSMAA
jgi:hypothetical protein